MKNISKTITLHGAEAADQPVIARLLALGFGFSPQRAAEYIGHMGISSFRLVRDDAGETIACAGLLIAAHMIHGAAVPAGNIVHVAIAPQARGGGLARPLMAALCEEARQQGALMVSLFASTRPVYRKCGFELAGSEVVYEAETAALPSGSRVAFAALAPDDERIKTAYGNKAAAQAGLLQRADAHWAEVTRAPSHALAAFGVGDEKLSAYLVLDSGNADCLEIRDWHAEDGAMAEALLCFLGQFRSVYPKVRWHGAPEDDLVAAMPDKGWRLAHQEDWLARILDPAAALQRRRYGIRTAEIGIRIAGAGEADAEIRLEIASGRASATVGAIGGMPAIKVDRLAFASLFTGFRSASALARRGSLFGDADAVQLCDQVFVGPRPWVAEHF